MPLVLTDFSNEDVTLGIDSSSDTKLFTVGSGFCTMIACVMLASGTLLTTGAAAWPPGQIIPVWHLMHGLVPGLEPWLEYPGMHVQLFCEKDMSGEMLLYGHLFIAPYRHQYPFPHAAHVGPPYMLSHTHGHTGVSDVPWYVALLGLFVHGGHTRFRVARQVSDWYVPVTHVVQGIGEPKPAKQ